jgi:hypothetical protein
VRGEKKYLRGTLDSAHFSSHEKSNYRVKMQQENSAHIRFRNLTIWMYILSKHRELSKHINIHEIAEIFLA